MGAAQGRLLRALVQLLTGKSIIGAMKSALLLAVALLLATGAKAQQPAAPDGPAAEAPAYSVVEPKAPAKAKRAARNRAAKANAKAKAKAEASAAPAKPALTAEAETLKRSGPCVIKPVMSDQDLVNCGARPQH